MKKISAGLLMYRINKGKPEILLVHPGGPFHKNKDQWGIPKGLVEGDEDLLETAKREFSEETGFEVKTEEFIKLTPLERSDKTIYIWAFEGDCDPSQLKSNTCMVEWPPKSGKQIEIPEVDKGEFFGLETARKKVYLYYLPLLDEFEVKISEL